jgi:dTDP-4-dehydrorhamnose 3,5-epimerase
VEELRMSGAGAGGIDGVEIVAKRRICDDRGAIFHMLRRDDPEFREFGEIYFSQIYPLVVKAWHIHSRMTLNYMLLSGAIRLVLFDDRDGSPSKGTVQEIFLSEVDSPLVVIPPLVWNGFKGLGTTPSLVANCGTEAHDPAEISRRPHDDPYFHYDWSQRHG